ncbi:MAG: succinylglutamate desuccinylase/aspartoacylase family protein [Candidatus Bipolaricaulia bacterium]
MDQARPGSQIWRLRVRELADGSLLTLPCGTISGPEPGPRVCILAGQHGNEWNGIYLIRRLYIALQDQPVRGTLVLLPVVHPMAFNERERVDNLDQVDLNRTYTVQIPRKPTEHLGQALYRFIFSRMDYLIDLHSGGPGEYLPHIIVTPQNDLSLLAYIGLPYIHRVRGLSYHHLTAVCAEHGVNAFTVEIGQGRHLDHRHLASVKEGLLNFLRAIELLPGPATAGEAPRVFVEKRIVSAPHSGFFTAKVDLGTRIEAGDLLGHIEPILGGTDIPIPAPCGGTVLYLRRQPPVGEGDSLAHIVCD